MMDNNIFELPKKPKADRYKVRLGQLAARANIGQVDLTVNHRIIDLEELLSQNQIIPLADPIIQDQKDFTVDLHILMQE